MDRKLPEHVNSPFPGFSPLPGQAAFYHQQRQCWLAFRYAEVQRVLSDYTVFSNDRGGLDPAQKRDAAQSTSVNLIAMDPPRHRQYRTLVTQAFTPRTVAQLEPRIQAIVQDLLNAVREQGTMDVVDDFSYPLSITVIAEMLGVPVADREQFKLWTEAFFEITTPEAAKAQQELGHYFLNVFEQRRKHPQDDLITALLAAQVDGQSLTTLELTSFCSLLLLAGNDTTRNLVANAVLCFDTYPDTMGQLIEKPDLLPGAIEEVLRFLPSVQTAPRMAKADTTLDGQQVFAGQWVMPMLASANRDPAQFPNPDLFDIQRTPNRHLTFGYGVHFCLGAPLARLEAKIALGAMLEELKDIQRVHDAPLEPVASPIVYGVKHLPITFRTN